MSVTVTVTYVGNHGSCTYEGLALAELRVVLTAIHNAIALHTVESYSVGETLFQVA